MTQGLQFFLLESTRIYRDNGKSNGNYRNYRDYIGVLLGLYWDNGKENGNYYIITVYILGLRSSRSAKLARKGRRFGG